MPLTDSELRDLYVRYAPVLHHRARAILGSSEEADDAVQETFARVVRNWDRFRQEASPLTWMYQINTNWCLNRLRNRRGHDRKHQDHAGDIVPRAYAELADGLDAATLRTLLDGEDDETRRVMVHLYFDDMTREDAAKLVGISVPTLRKRHDAFLKRARRALGAAVALVLAVFL